MSLEDLLNKVTVIDTTSKYWIISVRRKKDYSLGDPSSVTFYGETAYKEDTLIVRGETKRDLGDWIKHHIDTLIPGFILEHDMTLHKCRRSPVMWEILDKLTNLMASINGGGYALDALVSGDHSILQTDKMAMNAFIQCRDIIINEFNNLDSDELVDQFWWDGYNDYGFLRINGPYEIDIENNIGQYKLIEFDVKQLWVLSSNATDRIIHARTKKDVGDWIKTHSDEIIPLICTYNGDYISDLLRNIIKLIRHSSSLYLYPILEGNISLDDVISEDNEPDKYNQHMVEIGNYRKIIKDELNKIDSSELVDQFWWYSSLTRKGLKITGPFKIN